MERRQLLKTLAAGTALTAVPLKGFAGQAITSSKDSLAVTKQLFDKALSSAPELIGFKGATKPFNKTALTIEGNIPKDIQGCFYRNGAARHERAQQRYNHLFEGDGMIQAFHFEEGNIYHQGQFVQTSKFKKEEQAGKFLYSGPDSQIQGALPVSSPDDINTANTNIISVDGKLWALWEAGSPVALSADTLQTHGVVNLGENSRFGNKLKGLAFSAHPKIDPKGDIWNFGFSPSGHIVLFHLNAKGVTQNVNMIKTNYKGAMLHDFLITHRHILIILPSLVLDRTKSGFFGAINYDANLPMDVLVIDKDTLTLKRQYKVAPGFAFHYGNAWEEPNGTIHFDACLYRDANALHFMKNIMQGDQMAGVAPAKTTLYSLFPDGKYKEEQLEGSADFPRIHPSKVGIRNQYLYSTGSTEVEFWFDSVSRTNMGSGKVDKYVYGKDFVVEEHIPIATDENEDNGYLMGTALHIPTKRTCLNIFHANDISQGPICRAWLPYHIPLGFHGNFVAKS